jgi:hypothetical protein
VKSLLSSKPVGKDEEDDASFAPITTLLLMLEFETDRVIEARARLTAEKQRRYNGEPSVGTMEALARKWFPDMPERFDETALKEIELLYIHEMVKQQVRRLPVRLRMLRQDNTRTTIEGWNEGQQEQIVAWFGARSLRGRYFKGFPKVWNATHYLASVPVAPVAPEPYRAYSIHSR